MNAIKRAGMVLGICAGLVSMPGPLVHAASAQAELVPAGYHLAYSGQYNAAPGLQTHGSATCPGNEVPASGGLINESAGYPSSVNSSYPSGHSWLVDFNNPSSLYSGFVVYAVCLAPNPARRVVRTTDVTVASGRQASGFRACPKGTKVIGGGAVSFSASTLVALNDSYPVQNGWRVDVNNRQVSDSLFTVYAVCQPAPLNYSIRTSPTEDNAPGATDLSQRPCGPSPTNVAIAGGLASSSTDPAVQLYDSFPNSSNGWTAHEQNGGSGIDQITAYAICAGS
jgi:hypothetical protein